MNCLDSQLIIHIDMDDTVFDYRGAYSKAIEQCSDIKYPQSQLDFFRNLKLLDGAYEAVIKLNNIANIYFLTAPSTKNLLSYTEKALSLRDNFGQWAVDKLIICPNKGLVRGDYLIDDITTGKGQDFFGGELINIYSDKFPSWQSVIEYLNC